MEENTLNQSNKGEKRKLSVQECWAQAAKEGIEAGRKMTHAQALQQFRQNSGWKATQITSMPKPGMSKISYPRAWERGTDRSK